MKHSVEIYINNEIADQFEDGLDLRLNYVLYDPEKIKTNNTEYSYTFDLPVTDTNSRLFDYANIASKKNKFTQSYKATIYADGIIIFDGDLSIQEVENDAFKCNVYTPKINNLNEIFGDSKMNEFSWTTTFNGIQNINTFNANNNMKFFFPLVSYGLFQKVPEETLGSGHQKYSDKYTIDDTNRFYYNSFVPSLNMVELLKRICQSKRYQLQGDIITDPVLNQIYLSNYIADDQDPEYNYGGTMGTCTARISFTNWKQSGTTYTHPSVYTSYELQHPPKKPLYNNYDVVTAYNLMDETINTDGDWLTLTKTENNSKMIVNGGIQIPVDGWYQISCPLTAITYTRSLENIAVKTNNDGDKQSTTITYSPENMPIEFQLLRYDADDGEENNLSHDIIYFGEYPNESSASTAHTETGSVGRGDYTPQAATAPAYTNVPASGDRFTNAQCTTVVDPFNNPNFICGFQNSMYGLGNAYIKDGYSWSPDCGDVNRAMYNCKGYYKKASPSYVQTEFNKNTLSGASQNTLGTTTTSSYVEHRSTPQCVVYLHKNDMLIPYLNIREYEKYSTNESTLYRDKYDVYNVDFQCSITVKALAKDITPRSTIKYGMTSVFDKSLNLANFCNKTQKMSDFINDVAKAFNLTVTTTPDAVVMNKQRIIKHPTYPIDLDSKTNHESAILTKIEYPKSIEVKYKTNNDEETIYRSAERNATDAQLQQNNWLDYADLGYDKITISNYPDAQAIEEQLNFAYTGYETFTLPDNSTLDLPVIAKSTWFIEGLDYEKYQQEDGRGLTQRFWLRTTPTDKKLPVVDSEDYVIVVPVGVTDNNIHLDYKRDNSLLSEFFHVSPDSSADGVEVEVYLTPLEYQQIKNGTSVKWDDNIYQVLKIDGYDPTNANTTKLHLLTF